MLVRIVTTSRDESLNPNCQQVYWSLGTGDVGSLRVPYLCHCRPILLPHVLPAFRLRAGLPPLSCTETESSSFRLRNIPFAHTIAAGQRCHRWPLSSGVGCTSSTTMLQVFHLNTKKPLIYLTHHTHIQSCIPRRQRQ